MTVAAMLKFKGPDIVAWAMSGHMSICGPPEGPPNHVSHHSQAMMMGGADAAVGDASAWRHAAVRARPSVRSNSA